MRGVGVSDLGAAGLEAVCAGAVSCSNHDNLHTQAEAPHVQALVSVAGRVLPVHACLLLPT